MYINHKLSSEKPSKDDYDGDDDVVVSGGDYYYYYSTYLNFDNAS